MSEHLIKEARERLKNINIHAMSHDLAFQYRGGVMGRNVTEVLRDVTDALEAAEAKLQQVKKYADERAVYGRNPNRTVGSWRIASDLHEILGIEVIGEKRDQNN